MSEVVATLTNIARRHRAHAEVYGYSYKVMSFVIGSEGHDPEDPLNALNPDVELVEIPGKVFGEEEIDSSGWLSETCPYWECRLEQNEAVGTAISSIGLIAEIVSNGDNPTDLVGTRFLYAVANTPLNVKTGNDSEFVFTIGIQY